MPDTAAKRESSIMVGLPFRALLPEADGFDSIDDRAFGAFDYASGEMTASPPEPDDGGSGNCSVERLGGMQPPRLSGPDDPRLTNLPAWTPPWLPYGPIEEVDWDEDPPRVRINVPGIGSIEGEIPWPFSELQPAQIDPPYLPGQPIVLGPLFPPSSPPKWVDLGIGRKRRNLTAESGAFGIVFGIVTPTINTGIFQFAPVGIEFGIVTPGIQAASGPDWCAGGEWRDTCTDADDTPAEDHTGETTPGGYTDDEDVWQITSNRLESRVPTQTIAHLVFDPGEHAYIFTGQFIAASGQSGGAAQDFYSVRFRYGDPDNFIELQMFSSAGGLVALLYNWESGVPGLMDAMGMSGLGNFTITLNADQTVRIDLEGATNPSEFLSADLTGKHEGNTKIALFTYHDTATPPTVGGGFDTLCLQAQ